MRLVLVAAFALFTCSAMADDGQKTQQVIVQPLDIMQACYLKNDVYSKGTVVTLGDVKLLCERGKDKWGNRSDLQPLEWVKL